MASAGAEAGGVVFAHHAGEFVEVCFSEDEEAGGSEFGDDECIASYFLVEEGVGAGGGVHAQFGICVVVF